MESSAGRIGNGAPYIASPKSGGNSPTSLGKSKHMNTIKSLSLLHDLKEYITKVECSAAEQKRELERVKGEKKEFERTVNKIGATGGVRGSADFTTSAMSDMPPKLRAVFEENKILRDQAKKLKDSNTNIQNELTRRNQQVLVMEDSMTVLKQKLQSCSRSPEQVSESDSLQAQLDASERRIKDLEHDVGVLTKKNAVDAKLAKQALAAVAREKEGLHRQMIVQAADVEERDRHIRALLLEARRMHKMLPPGKAAMFPGFALGATWEPPEAEPANGTTESALLEAGDAGAGGVHVMLVVVEGSREPHAGGAEPVPGVVAGSAMAHADTASAGEVEPDAGVTPQASPAGNEDDEVRKATDADAASHGAEQPESGPAAACEDADDSAGADAADVPPGEPDTADGAVADAEAEAAEATGAKATDGDEHHAEEPPAARELRPDQITSVFGYPRDLEKKYTLGRTLGAGSFGVVREATNADGKRFAVKTIGKVPKNKMSSPYYLRKLRAEVEIMSQLGASLNAVNLQEVFEDNGSIHLVMQLCEGGALLERVESKKYTEEFVVHIVRSMLRFLSQSHAKGFIYRDVKPDNFLFHDAAPDSPLKATDFGLAIKHPKGSPKLTSRSGTPAYMAPELIMQCYDEKCDVWSVGMLTYQLLTGRFPFWADVRRESLAEVWKAILTRKIKWDAEELAVLNPLAVDFLQKLLNRNPDERLSAEQALQHEWMQERSGDSGPLMGSVVQRLQRFSTYGSLKQLVLKMIADEAMKADNDLPSFEMLSPELMAGLQELFVELDDDGSGEVSLDELSRGLRTQGYNLSDNEIDQLMRRVDADGSGNVDISEFFTTLIDWNKVKQTDAWDSYVDFAFAKLDKDGNGTIDLDELLAQLPETQNQQERMAVAKSLLREADVNGDGMITPAEFRQLLEHQRLVDSLSFYDSRLSTQSLSSMASAGDA